MASEEKSESYLKYGLCGLLSVTLVATPILLGVFFSDFPTGDPGILLSNCINASLFTPILYIIYCYTIKFLRNFQYLILPSVKGTSIDRDEIRVNPGGTSNFGHYGEKNVTYCTLRRPNKQVALLNDFQKNPNPDGRNTR